MMRQTFPAKQTSETYLATFPFQDQLAAGVTISTPSVSVTVFSGVDANPSAILSGSPAISGTNLTQLITAGVGGTIYEVEAQAYASDGQVLRVVGYIAVQPTP